MNTLQLQNKTVEMPLQIKVGLFKFSVSAKFFDIYAFCGYTEYEESHYVERNHWTNCSWTEHELDYDTIDVQESFFDFPIVEWIFGEHLAAGLNGWIQDRLIGQVEPQLTDELASGDYEWCD